MGRVRRWLLVAALWAAACGDDEEAATTSTTTTSTTPPTTTDTTVPATQDDAIAAWVEADRDDQFPGFEGPYVGPCGGDQRDALCTIPREDLGSRAIVGIGVAASDWGADLLLVEGDAGWEVVASWGWDLESDALGPPFSPLTAIAEWWASEDPSATFVRECDQPDPSITDQRLVCAELLDVADDRLTYRTGPVPGAEGREVVLELRPDESWSIAP